MTKATIPDDRRLFEFVWVEVQTLPCIKRHVDKIKDAMKAQDEVNPDDEEKINEIRSYKAFRRAINEELRWIQKTRVDAQVRDGVTNMPFAVAQKKAKAEEEKAAKKEKDEPLPETGGSNR